MAANFYTIKIEAWQWVDCKIHHQQSLIPIYADTDVPTIKSRENVQTNFATRKSRENVETNFATRKSRENVGTNFPTTKSRENVGTQLPSKNPWEEINAGAELPPLSARGRR